MPLGFERGRVLLAVIDARRADLAPAARLAAYERIHQRVLAVPGVEQAAVSITAPLGAMWSRRIDVSGSALRGSDAAGVGPEGFGFTDRPIPGNAPLAVFNGITPGWMATFGTPLLAGRDISERDGPGSPRVALVNQAFARKFLGGANPVGHTIHPTREPGSPPIEIVGLVADAVYRDVREPTLPTAYVPLSQSVDRSLVEDPAVTAPAVVTLSVRAASAQPGVAHEERRRGYRRDQPDARPDIRATRQPDQRSADARAAARDPVGVIRRPRAVDGGRRPLWRDVVRGEPPADRNRHSHGARRDARGRSIRLVLARVSMLVGAGIVVGLAIGAWASRFVATLLYRSRAGRSGHTRRVGSDIGAHRCRCRMASGAPRLTS